MYMLWDCFLVSVASPTRFTDIVLSIRCVNLSFSSWKVMICSHITLKICQSIKRGSQMSLYSPTNTTSNWEATTDWAIRATLSIARPMLCVVILSNSSWFPWHYGFATVSSLNCTVCWLTRNNSITCAPSSTIDLYIIMVVIISWPSNGCHCQCFRHRSKLWIRIERPEWSGWAA